MTGNTGLLWLKGFFMAPRAVLMFRTFCLVWDFMSVMITCRSCIRVDESIGYGVQCGVSLFVTFVFVLILCNGFGPGLLAGYMERYHSNCHCT